MDTIKSMSSSLSYITHLECSDCGREYSYNEIHTFCPNCQSPLLSIYDLKKARQEVDRDEISRRSKGMWRWAELLPVVNAENQVFLGEGDTPLLSLPQLGAELGLTNLYVKDESSNPTGSFKARGLSAAISKAKELGVKKVIIPTAGNAGGAMAAYAARAGLQAHIFMPKDTPYANIEESRMAGAEVILVNGLISDAAGMAFTRYPPALYSALVKLRSDTGEVGTAALGTRHLWFEPPTYEHRTMGEVPSALPTSLDQRIAPRLAREIARIQSSLDEREREERSRLKHLVRKLAHGMGSPSQQMSKK